MHPVGAPRATATAIARVVEEYTRLVAEFGARRPIEARRRGTRIPLCELRRLPVFNKQDGISAQGTQCRNRRVELDVELVPSKDWHLRVITRAAAFLNRDDDGVRRQ